MRILVLANIGMGLFKFRRELLEKLVENNEVFFSVPEGDFVDSIIDLGCKFVPCNALERRSTNPLKDIRLIREYFKIIRRIKPDVVLTYTIKPNIYGGLVCRIIKIPYIENITGLGTAIENGGLLSKISIMLYKVGLKRAECVFFQNADNQKLFRIKHIVKSRTRLIPGSGVNLDIHIFEQYPEILSPIRFLYVGRILKDKGINELLSAFRIIHNSYPDILLDIVGFCDEDYSETIKMAETEGTIVFHGLKKDVHSFYKQCHCVVLPSYHEGMANVLLEASSTGRPVITTRVSGCRETFVEGETGFGCEPRDVDSLVEAFRKFLELSYDKKRQMGIAARRKIENEFDRNIVINAYLEEIEYATAKGETKQ